MDLELDVFIHGVPSGNDFWGKDDDRAFFESFYNQNSPNDVNLLVRIRKLNGKIYCYYNYLVYKNVVGNTGRPGSYFGISFRFNVYCKDIMNMYKILDTLYNVYILGHVLVKDGTELKYKIDNFDTISQSFKAVEKCAFELISNAFSAQSFVSLDGFNLNADKYPSFNLYDCTEDNVMSAMKQYGKVAISQYYLSVKEATIERQYKEQVKVIQEQCEARIKSIDASADSVKNEVKRLNDVILQQEEKIKKQNEIITSFENEIKNIGQAKKIAQIIAPIKDQIIYLASTFQTIFPTEKSNKKEDNGQKVKRIFAYDWVRRWFPGVNFILLLLIVIILLLPTKGLKTVVSNESNNLGVKISLKTLIAAMESDKDKERLFRDKFKYKDSSNDIFNIEDSNESIIRGESLKKEGKYIVSVNPNEKEVGKACFWIVEGCKMEKMQTTNEIMIEPIENEVVIKFFMDKKIYQKKFDVI